MNKLWSSDEELFCIARQELFTALVGDILDKMGLYHQFLPANIKPLSPSMMVIGRAMPVLEADVFGDQCEKPENPQIGEPFGLMFEALDNLRENEVYICSGASPVYALWGGLMTTRAQYLKAAGAVVNGYSRDTNEILQLNFPVFSMGSYAQDQGVRGKVIDYASPIEFAGIRIYPGDVVFGDRDGVLIVPQQAVEESFVGAIQKARDENIVRNALRSGMTSADAFKKYKVM